MENVDSLWRGKYYDKVSELNDAEKTIEKQNEAIDILMAFAVRVRAKTYADRLCTEEANAIHTSFYKLSREYIVRAKAILGDAD